MDEFIWSQKYRPKKVSETILPDRIKKVFQGYVDADQIPNLILFGPPGVGKTTVAIAMCEELQINYLKINASSERGIDTLRMRVVSYASTMSFTGKPKVIILDEADALTNEAQDALKGVIEEFSHNTTFILTCNHKARLNEAIHSRTSHVDFRLQSTEKPGIASELFKRLREILTAENVKFEDEILVKIINKYFPDFRRTLNELQTLSRTGDIDASVLSKLSDIKNIKELMKNLKDKDFTQMRKWVVVNMDNDPNAIFRKIYDAFYSYLEPASIPSAVIILAKYEYQSAFAVDPEINLVACLTELMIDCQIKD